MDKDIQEASGACHCKRVQFRVRLANGLRDARRCTCSMCSMRGAVAVSAKLDDLELTAGADVLSSYQFNTMSAKHYFCSVCGIYTHHHRRSNPDLYAINVACLEGISPFDFEEVPVNDGVRHIADTGELRLAGILRFIPEGKAS